MRPTAGRHWRRRFGAAHARPLRDPGAARDRHDAAIEFSAAERAALRLARDGAIVPNAVTPQHFTELEQPFRTEEIVELVAVISLFGWLNRWNDTISTELEVGPLAFGLRSLGGRGWDAGKHAHETTEAV